MSSKNDSQVTIRAPSDVIEKIKEMGIISGRKASGEFRQALIEYVERNYKEPGKKSIAEEEIENLIASNPEISEIQNKINELNEMLQKKDEKIQALIELTNENKENCANIEKIYKNILEKIESKE